MAVLAGLVVVGQTATTSASADATTGTAGGSAMMTDASHASGGAMAHAGMSATADQSSPMPLPETQPQPVPAKLPQPPAGRANASVPDFVTLCSPSHVLSDDPIVFPRQPGKSHQHSFFGNRTTKASSNIGSLKAARATTCQAKEDFSAYWVPSLLKNGKFVRADHFKVYYRAGTISPAKIKTPPAGLRMIAGDARATGPQDRAVTEWSCNGKAESRTIPARCSGRHYLTMHVYFPNCWDGKHLDSADHKSHMAYSHNGACPSSHPVPIAKITQDVGYDLTDTRGVSLASGGTNTAHADFMNGWTQSVLDDLVKHCINGRRDCGEL